jgi:hypothetical protein
LASAALLAAFLFLFSLREQASELDANRSLAALLRDGAAVRLGESEVLLQRCEGTASTAATAVCEARGSGKFTFPAPSALEDAIRAAGRPRPNSAVVRFPLGERERAFLKARPQAALVLVRSVQATARGLLPGVGTEPPVARGVGQNVVFPFDTRALLAEVDSGGQGLRVQFDFPGLGWFGPSDVPAVLVDLAHVDALTSLPLKLTFASRLSWQLELGFPLLLAATSLVLDHSKVFGYACLYAVARAVRTFLNTRVADGSLDPYGPEGLFLYAACGLCVPLLILFTRSMCGLPRFRARFDVPFLVVAVSAFCMAGRADSDFVMTSDLWSDALSAGASFCLGLGTLAYRLARGLKDRLEKEEDAGQKQRSRRRVVSMSLGQATRLVPLALLLVGLVITAFINLAELRAFAGQGFKNPLDWRHMALFPFLLTTALFEVGSTSRRIAEVSREIEEKTRLDDALRIAENIHGRMLPPPRGQWPGLGRWRALYVPAHGLGGDWYDVREIALPDGRRCVVGCIVDLTGHGIGPSLSASALCSRWREWWSRVSAEGFGAGGPSQALAQAALRMHRALASLSSEETATACFFLLSPDRRSLAYLTCAHPGLILETAEGEVATLQTRAGGLGAERERYADAGAFPVATRDLPEGVSTLCAFTDGFCLAPEGVLTWAHRLTRQCKGQGKSVSGALARAFRAALREEKEASRDPAKERELDIDDKTLLAVTITTA